MIEVLKGASMASGPRGIGRSGAAGPAAPARPNKMGGRENPPAPSVEPDTVVRISPLASDLSRNAAVDKAERTAQVERIAAQVAANTYEIEPRKIAEALLKQAAPELYEALVAAGEVEE